MNMHILVVEDEADLAELIRQTLEAAGNSSVWAQNADEADRLLEQERVDGVTLDLGMPGTDGLNWLERVTRERPALARRTLIITGREMESDAVEQVAAYGAGVLTKPFTIEGLHDAVRAQIGRWTWLDELVN